MSLKKTTLTLSCTDDKGIVAALTSVISSFGGFIEASDQFSDLDTNLFFIRILFSYSDNDLTNTKITELLLPTIEKYGAKYNLQDTEYRPKLLLLGSKEPHCIQDLLSRWHRGTLKADIKGLVSNHKIFEEMASWYRLPFYHLPITQDTKAEQESQIRSIIHDLDIDLIVLARYMQILSPGFCDDYFGKIINIHHSFLPAFKGANPYARAHQRGVKLIGATAHYATSDLDEGPIICQDVIRVKHFHTVEDYRRYGSDIETLVLHRAIKNHIECRVFINGNKTVVL